MKHILLLFILLFFIICIATSQERYYNEIAKGMRANHEINLNDAKPYSTDIENIKIESLVLLKPKKSWDINKMSLLRVINSTIYTKDTRGENLFIFDTKGNPIRTINFGKFNKKFRITGFEVYNDTIYLVDNESLFLFKFSKEGNLISKSSLTFNFEDFQLRNQGIYFISKHWEDKRKKSIRISLFDFSLNLLKQYFIADSNNKSELRPKFVAKNDNDLFFLATVSNQIYCLKKDKVNLYLKVNGGDFISSYTKATEFHQIIETDSIKGYNYTINTKYYFRSGELKNGISIKKYNPLDLSIFFRGENNYIGNWVCLTDILKNNQIENILKMNWVINHNYIKEDLLELISEVNEKNRFVFVRYKVIENSNCY
ncbi:MAG: 6-bladed beta-propeller [Carboxylicivirga sp.]|jgi:hypothetical protein|nr:6-bladed beta-propeller [Carboxylicivirga sp.]